MSEIHVTIISSTVGKNPYKKWSSPHNKKKRVQNAILRCSLKNDRMISDCVWSKPLNITAIRVIPQMKMLKKLKLNGSMKTYKTF